MEEAKVNEKTWVPLGVAVAAIAAFAGGAVWLNTALVRIDLRLQGLEEHHLKNDGRWVSINEFFTWSHMLRVQNPEIDLPDMKFDR